MGRGFWDTRRRALAAAACLALAVGGAGLAAVGRPAAPRGIEQSSRMSVQEAPDSASALVAAKRQQSPVRVADLTTETRLVQARPDGHMAAEMTTVPVRVRHNGSWQPIDTTLEVKPDGSVAEFLEDGQGLLVAAFGFCIVDPVLGEDAELVVAAGGGGSVAEFTAYTAAESEKWAAVIRRSGARVD